MVVVCLGALEGMCFVLFSVDGPRQTFFTIIKIILKSSIESPEAVFNLNRSIITLPMFSAIIARMQVAEAADRRSSGGAVGRGGE